MILKESKFYKEFNRLLNNDVKKNLDNINIGLEFELQTNNKM